MSAPTPSPTTTYQGYLSDGYNNSTLGAYVGILWTFLFGCSFLLVRVYADRKAFNYHTYLSVFVAYFCSFGIIVLAPTDVALTVLGRRQDSSLDYDTSYEKYNSKVFSLYNSMFWPCVILGSVVMPFQEIYNQDGHFTPLGKVFGAFKSMGKYYLACGVAAGVIVGALLGSGYVASLSVLSLTVKSLSNTAGLVMIVLLLGYGLVEFPRSLWRAVDYELMLLTTQMNAAAEFKNFGEISLQCSLSVANVVCTATAVRKMKNAALLSAVEDCLQDCPKEFHSGSAGTVATNSLGHITVDTLAGLRAQLNLDAAAFKVSQARIEKLKREAYFYEDLVGSRRRQDGVKKVKWSFGLPESHHSTWRWYFVTKPILYRCSSLFCWSVSFLFLLAYIGVMSGFDSGISFFSKIVHDPNASVAGITIFTFASLLYFSFVILWALGKMRIAGQLELQAGQQTSPYSLSFNARMCAKLAPTIVFSYFGLVYENGVAKGPWTMDVSGNELNTAYAHLFGEMAVVPVIGGKFNVFFPALMICLSFLQLANLINRILVFVRLPGLQFGTEIVDEGAKHEGIRQLVRHRKQMERAAQRGANKEMLNRMKDGGYFASLWGKSAAQDKAEEAPKERELRQVPPEISGWIEKKAVKQLKTFIVSPWQNRLFIIRSPGILTYYDSPDTNKQPCGSIELRVVMSIRFHTDGGKTYANRLDLDLADRNFKLRFENEADCKRWMDALLSWKDYAIEYGHEFATSGNLHDDDERDYGGGNSSNSDKEGGAGRGGGRGGDNEVLNPLASDLKSRANDLRVGSESGRSKSVSERGDISRRRRESAAKVVEKVRAKRFSTITAGGQGGVDDYLVEKPASIMGCLQKRHVSMTGLYSTWSTRYFGVNSESGMLNYWKSEKDAQSKKPPIGCVDLRLLLSCEIKKGVKLHLDLGEEVLKLKANTPVDAEAWCNGILAWQEYMLLHMELGGMGGMGGMDNDDGADGGGWGGGGGGGMGGEDRV